MWSGQIHVVATFKGNWKDLGQLETVGAAIVLQACRCILGANFPESESRP